jgi:LysR family transcriptional regulator, glycine cleavage system transcriptional activator
MRRLPSLNALRAFEAAARHQSFTRAAEELHVSQGAISHQVKLLEAQLGMALFRRAHHGLAITFAGQNYLQVVKAAFDQLALGTERLLQQENAGTLTVSMSPNFVAKWLVHRLGKFVAGQPTIDLRVNATVRHVDFTKEDIDLAVRHGTGSWPDLQVTPLCVEQIFPVCSPALLAGAHALREMADLRHHTLLHDSARDDWPIWLDAAGLADFSPSQTLTFDQSATVIDAAAAGQGVALARSALAAADLQAGRLLRPFALSLPAPFAYYIVCPKPTAMRAKIVAFRSWLLAEAAADARDLAALPRRQPQAASDWPK